MEWIGGENTAKNDVGIGRSRAQDIWGSGGGDGMGHATQARRAVASVLTRENPPLSFLVRHPVVWLKRCVLRIWAEWSKTLGKEW